MRKFDKNETVRVFEPDSVFHLKTGKINHEMFHGKFYRVLLDSFICGDGVVFGRDELIPWPIQLDIERENFYHNHIAAFICMHDPSNETSKEQKDTVVNRAKDVARIFVALGRDEDEILDAVEDEVCVGIGQFLWKPTNDYRNDFMVGGPDLYEAN